MTKIRPKYDQNMTKIWSEYGPNMVRIWSKIKQSKTAQNTLFSRFFTRFFSPKTAQNSSKQLKTAQNSSKWSKYGPNMVENQTVQNSPKTAQKQPKNNSK